MALRPAIFDRHVLAIYVTGFAQPFKKGGQVSRPILGKSGIHESDHRHCRLLGVGQARPRHRRTTEKSNKIATLHVPH